MSKTKVLVIHKPGGYEGYKDQVTIRKPNWKAILAMVGLVFGCGVIAAAAFLVPQLLNNKQPQIPTAIAIVKEPVTVDPAFSAIVSNPLPTLSPMPTQTPENIVQPTLDLMATVNFVSNQLELMQSQTAVPTTTGVPSLTPMPTNAAAIEANVESTPLVFDQYATVIVDCVVIRVAPGRQYQALDSSCRGAQYGVIETYGDWTRIYHPAHETAWIATWLLRVEAP